MSDVERADSKGQQRAVICYMMAGVLVFQAFFSSAQMHGWDRAALWIVTILTAGLCLTPVAGILIPRRVHALLNDEATRDHRRTAMNAAFWATLVAGSVVTLRVAIDPAAMGVFQAVRIVVTATLVVALVTFATLERRAGR